MPKGRMSLRSLFFTASTSVCSSSRLALDCTHTQASQVPVAFIRRLVTPEGHMNMRQVSEYEGHGCLTRVSAGCAWQPHHVQYLHAGCQGKWLVYDLYDETPLYAFWGSYTMMVQGLCSR